MTFLRIWASTTTVTFPYFSSDNSVLSVFTFSSLVTSSPIPKRRLTLPIYPLSCPLSSFLSATASSGLSRLILLLGMTPCTLSGPLSPTSVLASSPMRPVVPPCKPSVSSARVRLGPVSARQRDGRAIVQWWSRRRRCGSVEPSWLGGARTVKVLRISRISCISRSLYSFTAEFEGSQDPPRDEERCWCLREQSGQASWPFRCRF